MRTASARVVFSRLTLEKPVKHWTAFAAAGFLAAAAAYAPAQAANISGAGATFPYPIYAKWADAYKKETGNGLNYSPSAPAAASSRSRPRLSISAHPTCRCPLMN